jgi:ABC-2 type transport system permease protein
MSSSPFPADAPVFLWHSSLRAVAALVQLTLRQQLRGRRIVVLAALFALPGILAVVVGLASRLPLPAEIAEILDFSLVMILIPHALAPLAALLYAAGVIQDEVEDQTLTYLLLRPLPRWALYLAKLLATFLVVSLLTAVFAAATLAIIAILAGSASAGSAAGGLAMRAGLAAAALALAQAAYCGLFGFLGLITRRSLVVGVAYILLFEGLLASFDTVARRLTVMYYFRVLALRWLKPPEAGEWAIDLAAAPDARTCALVLLGIGLVLAAAGAVFFVRREFRVKTAEA